MRQRQQILSESQLLDAQRQLSQFRDAGKVAMRLLAISRLKEHTVKEVSEFFGMDVQTLGYWMRRYSVFGVGGLNTRPKGHRPSKLDEESYKEILRWLDQSQTPGGQEVHWTLERLSQEIKEVYGISVTVSSLWKQLNKRGYVWKTPRPSHAKAIPEAQEAFKKNGRIS